jgi:hypothetical protein
MSAVTHYFVWYRVQGDHAGAHAAVTALMQDVYRNAGVTGRVLVRRDDPRTWMEVYEHVADTSRFEQELAAAVARHDIARWSEGGARHTEPFVAPV